MYLKFQKGMGELKKKKKKKNRKKKKDKNIALPQNWNSASSINHLT